MIVVAAYAWLRQVLYGSSLFCTGWMLLASSRWFLLFLYSCGCFCKVVAGYLLLLKVWFGVGFFWPFLDGSCRFCRNMWVDLLRSALI